MSDDISIPSAGGARTAYTHSYRSRRGGQGVDSHTRMLMLAASALGFVLVAGMGVWSLSGHQRSAAGIPTIEADSRPVRIKPVDPGGMSVSMFGDAPASGSDVASDLAPAAERPDPQALLAQRQAAAAPPITSQVPAAASVAPVQAAPVVAQATPAAKPVPAAPAGTILVQLAAVSSEGGATTEWQRLSRKLPDMLGSRQPVIQRADLNGKPIWRLRTGGFGDMADATQFCKRAREKGIGCALASF